ncbi:hypothetical protein R3P38DRAFT_2919744 [Favolaschia claudopus]|uniref:Uncharacterized protein n=1 Tax=Favolaschia claudopus TaxID=2862362 RepID=A0AAW0BZT8_9AGAR
MAMPPMRRRPIPQLMAPIGHPLRAAPPILPPQEPSPPPVISPARTSASAKHAAGFEKHEKQDADSAKQEVDSERVYDDEESTDDNGPVPLAPPIPVVPANAATALLADLFTPPPDLRLAAIQRAAVGVVDETDPSWCPVLASFAAVDNDIIPLLEEIGEHASAPGVVVDLIASLGMILADASPRQNRLQQWVDTIVFKIGCAIYAQRYAFQLQYDGTFMEALIRRYWKRGSNGKAFERPKDGAKAVAMEHLRREAQRVARQHARVLDAYREHGAIVFLDPNWCFEGLEEDHARGAHTQDILVEVAVARHTAAEAAILNIVGAYCNSKKHRYIDQVCGLLWELRRSYAVLSGLGVQ